MYSHINRRGTEETPHQIAPSPTYSVLNIKDHDNDVIGEKLPQNYFVFSFENNVPGKTKTGYLSVNSLKKLITRGCY